jgi:hypothetical protein
VVGLGALGEPIGVRRILNLHQTTRRHNPEGRSRRIYGASLSSPAFIQWYNDKWVGEVR